MTRTTLPGRGPMAIGLVLAACLAMLRVATALAQPVSDDHWVPNGPVRSVVVGERTIYIAGDFTEIGPPTGSAVPTHAGNGSVLAMPKVVGMVLAVEPDGSGGWYLGGSFSFVGGVPRANLAHVLADHSLGAWNPSANATVRALAFTGGEVYVGGDFTAVGGAARNHIASLDPVTGTANPWDPDVDGQVNAIAVSPTAIYAGGTFDVAGGVPRNDLVALDPSTGLATSWDANADGPINALLYMGSNLYVGGSFSAIGGEPRQNLAALETFSGSAVTWEPNPDGIVNALAPGVGTVFVGGAFTAIGGALRGRLAEIDGSGVATTFSADADAEVDALDIDGSTLYAGGAFTLVSGIPRPGAVKIEVSSSVHPWNPRPNGRVRAMAVAGSVAFVAGEFTSVGGVSRNRIAALDAGIGEPLGAWDPNADGAVMDLALAGQTLYAVGDFQSIGGQARSRIAALDVTTGLATAWDPGADATAHEIVPAGGVVYVGGAFTTIGGAPRAHLAALDASTGLATAWNPDPNDEVFALAVDGNTVYAGGSFLLVGGEPRSHVAALDAATGLATAWNPAPNGFVHALAKDGGTVYAGGFFTLVAGEGRSGLAAIDATTGLPTPWNPDALGQVLDLAVSARLVYAAGPFEAIGAQPRIGLAAIDRITGTPTGWNPMANGPSFAIAMTDGGRIYAGGAFLQIGSTPHARLAAIARAPEIVGVSPASAGAGPTTLSIGGAVFTPGTIVIVSQASQPDHHGTQVQLGAGGTTLSATFDLSDLPPGPCTIEVVTFGGQVDRRDDLFVLEGTAPYEIRATILAPELMRANRRKAFDIVIENLGNTDVRSVPLWISRIPPEATVEADFPIAAPPQEGLEPDWSAAPITFDGPAGRYMALVIPLVPPGVSVRRLYLTMPSSVMGFELDASLTPPWTGDQLTGCLADGGVIATPSCVALQLAGLDAWYAASPWLVAVNGIGMWAKIAWQCEGAGGLPAALAEAEEALDFMLQPVEGAAAPGGCEVALVPRWRDRRTFTVVTSVDPNDKLGVGGVGPERLIGDDQLLPYSIRFENFESAPAPAQEVTVIDALDLATLDPTTVSLGPITFGSRTLYPPPGLRSYATEVDLRPTHDVIVRVGVYFDVATGVLSWSFGSIDPATGALPEDPLSGFLPPNVTPPEGEGSVMFTVMPLPSLPAGTSIANEATLVFDGDPLVTPSWQNRIDATPPASSVLPLGANQDSASFTVQWAAEDAPPDLHDFSVYVSEDGGPFRPWRVHTTATADTITAPGGHTYAFFSLARDSSGNLESPPATPDVETFSRVAVEGARGPRLALAGAAPNPAPAGAARVWFTLPDAARATLEVIDVAGRRTMRREVGALGAGRHVVDLGAAAPAPGLYFLRLARGGTVLTTRMAVTR
jgi:hypothetical protein